LPAINKTEGFAPTHVLFGHPFNASDFVKLCFNP